MRRRDPGGRPRGFAGRLLHRLLPDDDWSAEFVEELEAERLGRPGRLFWVRALLSPRTVRFVWMMRRRARMGRRAAGPRGGWVGAGQDVRQALRALVREPRSAAFIVATLALSIGSVSAMGGVARRLFLEGPVGVRAPEELVRILLRFPDEGLPEPRTAPWIPWRTASAIRDGDPAFLGVTRYRLDEILGRTVGAARPLRRAVVDDAYFDVLGATPAAGRLLGAGEVGTVAISQALAVASFGDAPAAIGRTIELGAERVTVVGVTRAGFAGPHLDRIDVWSPLDLEGVESRNWWVVARVAGGADGVDARRARADAQAIHERTDPGRFFRWAQEGDVVLVPVGADDTGRPSGESSVARLLLGVVGIVLLVGCANVANLLLARAARRRGELVVRLALGIGRGRLTRLLLTDSLLLALAGGAASVPVAWLAGSALRRTLLPGVAWATSPVDARLVGGTVVLALATGLLLGLLPLRMAGRMDLSRDLSTSRMSAGRGRARAQAALATLQVALAAALLVSAGLFLRSFWSLRVTDLGVAGETLAIGLRSMDPSRLRDGSELEEAAYRRALAIVRGVPGAERSALTIGLPYRSNFGKSVWIDGVDSIPELPGGGPFISAVGGRYFEAIGTAVVGGVPIGEAHVTGREAVAVVSATTARTLWPGRDALGACVRFDGPEGVCHRVIGVAKDVHRQGYREPPSLQFYVPLGTEAGISGLSLVVRPSSEAERVRARVAAALERFDPAVDHVEIGRLDELLDDQVRPWRLGAAVLTMTALLAVVVALVGVYGVLSYLVEQRRREIGVRIALGASGHAIRGLVLRLGLGAGGAGVAAGVTLLLGGRRWLQPLLFETSVTDPLVIIGVAVVLVGASVVACLLPASRAARVDPVACLKAEG